MSADQSTNPDQDLADGLATLTDEERAALNEEVDELKRDDSELGDDDEGDEAGDSADEAPAPAPAPAPKADKADAVDDAPAPPADKTAK